MMVELSVVFGTFNRMEMLRGCVESIRQAVGALRYEMIITDGGSTDGTVEYLKTLTLTLSLKGEGEVVLIEHGEMRGAVQAYYDAFKLARGDYVCYLSDDLTVPEGMLEAAVNYLKANSGCGVVSLPYKNPGQGVQHLVYATVGNKRLPFASFGVLRRAEGEKVDWMPRATYHFYLDVGICLNIQKLGLRVEALPGDYVIQHLMGDNIDRGRGRDSKYSSMRDAKAFHEYWEGRV